MTETMTRYYYDDPLAAAWMYKHHQMQFNLPPLYEGATITQPSCDAFINDFIHELKGDCGEYRTKWIVRPDNLQLLEPIVGDVLYNKSKDGGIFIEEINSIHRLAAMSTIIKRGAKIIQRNGKTFMSPEIETIEE